MLKTRLIPVLLLQRGLLVRSEKFAIHQIIGNPVNEVQRFSEWNVDELVYLDITRDGEPGAHRCDHREVGFVDRLSILDLVSRRCFMPLTWGGGIRTLDDMRTCFAHGADKITINTAAVQSPQLISSAAERFGSQAIVVSIDARKCEDDRHEVFIDGGRTATGLEPVDWAAKAEALGAGEILLQSIDRDGTGRGYDAALIEPVASVVRIPVIACGGVGTFEHYVAGVRAGASAVAAANLWHFKELAERNGKRALARAGVNVRM